MKSVSNRRSRSSRNRPALASLVAAECIESEIALKPERPRSLPARRVRVYRIGDRAQAGTAVLHHQLRDVSVSNRRSRSSRNTIVSFTAHTEECIESEIALKPELRSSVGVNGLGVYRIGDRAQAGTAAETTLRGRRSVSNRRSRSSRNTITYTYGKDYECIESEIALKPEHASRAARSSRGVYRIGDRAQAGTHGPDSHSRTMSVSNRRSRSSRNSTQTQSHSPRECIESEITLKPEPHEDVVFWMDLSTRLPSDATSIW